MKRYFGQFHPHRKDRWVFGSRQTGADPPRFGWTKIVRHDLVKGRASPDDPALAGYWAARRRKEPPPPVSADRLRLLRKQQGRCPLWGTSSCTPTADPRAPGNGRMGNRDRKAIVRHAIAVPGSPAAERKSALSTSTAEAARPPAAERHRWPACEPFGTCLSRGAGKPASPVLRGGRRSNAPPLPDRGVRPLKTQQKISGRLTSERPPGQARHPQLHRHRPQARPGHHDRPAQHLHRQPLAAARASSHLPINPPSTRSHRSTALRRLG